MSARIHRDIASSFKVDGRLVEYFKGDEVTDSGHIRLLDGWGALEPVDGDEPQQHERIHGAYDHATNDALEAEIEQRRDEGRTIQVTGTGQGGNVLKADLVAALEADDKA